MASILSRRCYLESSLDLDSKMENRHHSAAICSLSLCTALKMTVFRPSYENTILMKSAPLSGQMNVFDAHVARRSEKYQKRLVFARFILRHFGTSSRHLDRTRRDLDVKAAQYSKCAPLSGHFHVFDAHVAKRSEKYQ